MRAPYIPRRNFLRGAAQLSMAGLSGTSRSAITRAAPRELRTITPSFWKAYEGSAGRDIAERVKAVALEHLLPNAATYTAAGFNGGSHGRFEDQRVADWLVEFDRFADKARRTEIIMMRNWKSHQSRMRRLLPKYDPLNSAVLLMSLLSFNGYSAKSNGQQYLFFGLDTIASRDEDEIAIRVLMDHEGYHLYSASLRKEDAQPAAWQRVWEEGLASYVSSVLNPTAGLSVVLMDERLAATSAADIRASAAALRQYMEDTDVAGIASMLDMKPGAETGGRKGYLIGYLIAANRVGSSSVEPFCGLSDDRIRVYLSEGLTFLETADAILLEGLVRRKATPPVRPRQSPLKNEA